MRAAVHHEYGPPDVLRVEDVAPPVPGDRDVCVRVAAATVTAVDCTFRSGRDVAARLFTGLLRPKRPILGSEFAGVVTVVGAGVTSFAVGDRVFGTAGGTHAEVVCVPEDGPVARVPAAMPLDEAAAVPYGALTALPFLRDAGRLERDQRILVNGASGSVGTYAVQLAKHLGAEVTAVCSTPNVEWVEALGADEVIDYTREDFTTRPEAWDVVFDTVGKTSFSRCAGALRPGGIYLTTVVTLPILVQMVWTARRGGKRAAIAFTGLRPPADIARDLHEIRALAEAGTIRVVVDRRYDLDRIAEAHAYVERGHKKGNVLVDVAPEATA